MDDDKLKKIIEETSELMSDNFSSAEKIHERNVHLSDEDGKISAENMNLVVMNESIAYTHEFAYRLIKSLKENAFFSDSD